MSYDGDHAEVAITDNEGEVPNWFTSKLFDDFAQAGNGNRRGARGRGLGQPISQTLARTNGGQLTYRDTGDGAACVVRRLPTATPDVASRSVVSASHGWHANHIGKR